MDYENFKEQLMEEVRAGLYEKGFEVNVSSHNVDKLNESYDAITITPVNSNIGMNMNVSQMFEQVENGRDFQDVVDMTIDTATKHLGDMPEVDVNQLTDYEQMIVATVPDKTGGAGVIAYPIMCTTMMHRIMYLSLERSLRSVRQKSLLQKRLSMMIRIPSLAI